MSESRELAVGNLHKCFGLIETVDLVECSVNLQHHNRACDCSDRTWHNGTATR